jgi:glycosyltransferase involved in cell wall biosynthesis
MPAGLQPIRVFHVTGCLEVGGQEKLLVDFARHADRERFALHFVSLEKRGPLADDLEAEGWPVTCFDVEPGLWPGLVLQLARFFRREGANVVHTHNERPLIYAAPAAMMTRARRIIHTRHGRSAGITSRQILLSRLAARWVDRFVCVSEDASRLSIEQGFRSDRVETLHNGIDLQRFAAHGPAPEGPAVIVARLAPEKDIGTLLRATAIVARERSRFRLEIAGDGPSMPELSRLTAELGITDRVQFLGMVRDVPALLSHAGMYVLSSVTEGVSLTLLEAMACGLPVVATRVGGTPEVVIDSETGFLVPPSDPAVLAAALSRLFDDNALARRLGDAGRQRVERQFDVRRMVAKYEAMYAPSAGTITEDRHDAGDHGADGRTDRGAGQRNGTGGGALASPPWA